MNKIVSDRKSKMAKRYEDKASWGGEIRINENDFEFSFYNIQYENAGHLISRNPDSDSHTAIRKGKMNIDGEEYEFDFGGTMEGDNLAKNLARIRLFRFFENL